jgi:hypothetical protein
MCTHTSRVLSRVPFISSGVVGHEGAVQVLSLTSQLSKSSKWRQNLGHQHLIKQSISKKKTGWQMHALPVHFFLHQHFVIDMSPST